MLVRRQIVRHRYKAVHKQQRISGQLEQMELLFLQHHVNSYLSMGQDVVALQRDRERSIRAYQSFNVSRQIIAFRGDSPYWIEMGKIQVPNKTGTPPMNNASPAVADLQSKWHTLNDLDRARAVSAIQLAGTQIYRIAFCLNCSESMLSTSRH
jgi:hypothetical protein